MSAPFMPTVKASMHIATAKDTARHNDRSMYKDGYKMRGKNVHYDIMGMGNSHKSELAWYEKTFRKVLDAQNERAKATSHEDRMMTMEQYRLKHMPQELIAQIGTHEDFENGLVDDSYCLGVVEKIVKEIERSGGVVLSWDLHNDETEDSKFVEDITPEEKRIDSIENARVKGTPHLHLRFAMVNEKGLIDVKNTLLENGIKAPFESPDAYREALIKEEESRTDISEKMKQKNIEKIQEKTDKQIERLNTPKVTFTANLRSVAEEYGHQWCAQRGLILDDENRSKREHMELPEFKKYMEAKDRQALKEEIANATATLEKTNKEIEAAIVSREMHIESSKRVADLTKKKSKEMLEEAKNKADSIVSEAEQEALILDMANADMQRKNELLVKEIKDKEETLDDRNYGIAMAEKKLEEQLDFEAIEEANTAWNTVVNVLEQHGLLKNKVVKFAVQKINKFLKKSSEMNMKRERVEAIEALAESTVYESGLGD